MRRLIGKRGGRNRRAPDDDDHGGATGKSAEVTDPPPVLPLWRRFLPLITTGLFMALVLGLEGGTPLGINAVILLSATPMVASLSSAHGCARLATCGAVLALVPLSGGVLSYERLATVVATAVVQVICMVWARSRARLTEELVRTRWIADTVQQAVLRPLPARIGQARLAVRYVSATEGARVGGDLYDVLDTPFGLRVVIGDVRGSGLPAVEIMATVLGSFREAAYAEADLADVVRRLDEALARRPRSEDACEEDEDFVTLAVLSIDGTGVLRIANRGHLAPLLVRTPHPEAAMVPAAASAPGRRLPMPEVGVMDTMEIAPPLGLHGLCPSPSAVAQMPFTQGDSLVLHTDGITEARNRAGDFFPLAETIAAVWDPDPEAVVEQVHRTLLDHTRGALKDDATLLVLVHE